MNIALTGPMYSGKSTLANALVARGWVKIEFSRLLKQLYSEHLARMMSDSPTVEQIEQNKAAYRTDLQTFGRVIDFNNDPQYVLRALKPWVEGGMSRPAVFDNVRYTSQYMVLQRFDFSLVRLNLSIYEQEKRAARLGVVMTPEMVYDGSERGVDIRMVDLALDASLSTAELVAEVLNYAKVPAM
jgi:hypothetical protein